MGFKLSPDSQQLQFENEDLNEMKVQVDMDVPLSTFFDLQIWMASQEPQLVKDSFTLFGDKILMSWDIQDEDGDIPADSSGFLSLPFSLATAIITAWTTQVGSPKKKLGSSLNGTSLSAVEPIGTAT
tara:strand:- start:4100 stop:4480 length:381 start_codon:yes stop_codon:yes gene_type:complete